jgi:hypothetical protein
MTGIPPTVYAGIGAIAAALISALISFVSLTTAKEQKNI